MGLTRDLAQCFTDGRQQRYVDHSLPQLLAQRLYGLALGYEDINDHERLRRDPLLAAACDKQDPLGQTRFNPIHRGVALAAPSTLNRLELSNNKRTRYHRLPHDPRKIEACLLKLGARCLPKHAREIVPALEQIVAAIRQRCRKARILVRGDSGFCREEILAWCEQQAEVYYCVGLAQNQVLLQQLAPSLADARARRCLTGAATVRVFAEFKYRTQNTWSCARRVIGKAEVMSAGENPRFIVTNLPARGFQDDPDQERFTAARLYEELYCARGDMENKLKQQVLDLQADRMSTHNLASNQFRLWEATFAYLLLERLRTRALSGTQLERATVGSLRLHLLKVAAQVRVSVRRVYVQLSSAYPLQTLFRLCQQRLRALPAATG